LRTTRFSLLIASLALFFVHCGNSKPEPDAYAAMQKNKMVRMGTNPFNIPFETSAGTGVEGYDIDLGEVIAKDLNYPTKWIQWNEFNKLFDLLQNGELEMIISSVAITPERQKEFAFSEPYFDSSNTIARRRENLDIKDLASLAGKNVGVQTARTAEKFMETQTAAAGVKLTKFPTLDEALGALNRRELDAVVGDKPIMTYSISKNYSTNLITTGVELSHDQYAVVVRQKETKLLAQINETIRRLKTADQFHAWYDKWVGSVMTDATKENVKIDQEEKLKTSPKALSISFVKEAGSTVKLDRLDGFNATLTGANGSFNSTPIDTDEAGVKGSCRFTTPIPPGDYTLNLSRLKVSQPITVQKKAVTAFTVILTFTKSGGLSLEWR
jgi:ABC-type amino acid transport substrate-binding protein